MRVIPGTERRGRGLGEDSNEVGWAKERSQAKFKWPGTTRASLTKRTWLPYTPFPGRATPQDVVRIQTCTRRVHVRRVGRSAGPHIRVSTTLSPAAIPSGCPCV